MKVTAVIITRDRPSQVKHLVDSIFNSKIPFLSLVLIDDSVRENFENVESFLSSYGDICEHRSSLKVKGEVQRALNKMDLTKAQKSFIETCVGLKSPFLEFANSFSKINLFKDSFFTVLSGSFGPYSTARNLGIYSAYRNFHPEKIVFLDDDCYIKRPERLMAALQLIGKKIDGKEIAAVSGLYEDLSLSMQKGKHQYQELTPTSILAGMNSFLKRSFLTEQQQRLVLMPYHALGGALILSKRIFLSLPFDPFIPRGEDHAYCIDFKARYSENYAIVRDNLFVVQHNLCAERPRHAGIEEINALRDIFRFVYLRFKVGQCFVPYFTIRWTLNTLINMFREPQKSKQYLLELWALLFPARTYAKRNVCKYSEIVEAWKSFIKRAPA